MRLITFSHAGGFGNYYHPLKKLSRENISVINYEYPGHGRRLREPLKNSVEEVIRTAYKEIFSSGAQEKAILFGHSMGASFCVELAYILQQEGHEEKLAGMILSGALPSSYLKPCGVDLNDRKAILEYLESVGGTQPAIIDNQEFLDLYLHVVTRDLSILDDYTPHVPAVPFKAPLGIFYASDDPYLQPASRMGEWSAYTEAFLGERVYQGGHFYFNRQWDLVTEDLAEMVCKIMKNENLS